ncbi:DUF1963 domain-containing protein [Spirillospora sp. CA-294931]|uniref:DUF1963 domain-containing protein n=1 Tax=Spirillospora sp. CA-294931 TaxID=3240042 RepID=UPI003D8EC869
MDHFAAQRQRLHTLFGVFFAPEVIAALLALARPAVRLGAEGETTVRLGGDPLLPPGEPWPMWQDRPLDFLAAVDFSALPDVPGLPTEGRAAFYYCAGGPSRPWGDEPGDHEGWRVFTGDLVETPLPEGAKTPPACKLGAELFLSLPSPQEQAMSDLEETYSGTLSVYEQLHAAWLQHVWPDDTPVHQLGGWPVLVDSPQSHPAPDPAEDLRLVLQLDSDRRLNWHWGDPGRVFFHTHQDAPLESAHLTLQS